MQYNRVILSGRKGIPGVEETLNSLCSHLDNQKVVVFCTKPTAELIRDHKIEVLDENNLAGKVDLVVVVGGDGSLLQAAHFAVNQDLPVIGINRGRLGFLTDICPNSLGDIDAILRGKHSTEYRFMIDSYIMHEGKSTEPHRALNDVVLQANNAQMIAFDVFVDNQLVYEHRADGLIIATPTGSTAYALSGGGPILQPQLATFAIVPMFPHTLSSRPIVVSANSVIRIKISPNQKVAPTLSNDGHKKITVHPGSEIFITQHKKKLQLLHPSSYNYYHTLREKLNWERSPRRSTD
jgi:NAD+ kinase